MPLMTSQAADGSSLPAVQPVTDSVTGSPFTVTSATAVPTPELTGMLLVISSNPIHVNFSKDGDAATTDDFQLPAGQVFAFPMDGDILSMIAASTTATVWTNLGKELS